MSFTPRSPRQAALKADDNVGAIARQEEETRTELFSLAQFQERSAHIERVPSLTVTLESQSERWLQFLRKLAIHDPEISDPVQPFATFKFHSDIAKERFQYLIAEAMQKEIEWKSIRQAAVQAALHVNSAPIVITDDSDETIDLGGGDGFEEDTDEDDNEDLAHSSRHAPQEMGFLTHLAPIKRMPPIGRFNRGNFKIPIQQDSVGILEPDLGHYNHGSSSRHIHHFSSMGHTENGYHNSSNNENSTKAPSVSQNMGPSLIFPSQVRPNPVSGDSQPTHNVIPHHQQVNGGSINQVAIIRKPKKRPYETISTRDKDPRYFRPDFMSLPPRSLQEHMSYRVGPSQNQRLMKYQAPPIGWEGCVHSLYRNDYSDPRFWSAPARDDQNIIVKALRPTVKEYIEITGERFNIGELTLLPFGYEATYNQIQNVFSQWCFYKLGFSHQWIVDGKVVKKLFKLERWYGLLEDYGFAPNWPLRLRDSTGRIVQNPDCFACDECIELDKFCHGHREDYNSRCKPCLDNGRYCSKRLV